MKRVMAEQDTRSCNADYLTQRTQRNRVSGKTADFASAVSGVCSWRVRDKETRTQTGGPYIRAQLHRLSGRANRCQRKTADDRVHETLKIFKLHPHKLAVRSGVEGDFLVVSQRLFDIDGDAIQIAEGRHCAEIAIRKFELELGLGGEAN